METVHHNISLLRDIGLSSGLKYPAKAPTRDGGSVPRDTGVIPDQLHVSSYANLFAVPDLTAFKQDHGLADETMESIDQLFHKFRESVTNKFVQLYTASADALSQADDGLIFYLDLYSHVDACLRDMLRDKMASLFRQNIKSDVLAQSSSKKLKNRPDGLFGG